MIRYFSLLLILIPTFVSAQDNIFGLKATQKFANHLFNSENYDQAAYEYERLILLDSSNTRNYQLKALQSYRKGQNLETGFNRFNDWYPEKSRLDSNLSVEFSKYLIDYGYYQDAISFLKTKAKIDKYRKHILSSVSYCFLEDWEMADQELDSIKSKGHSYSILKTLIRSSERMKYKKPGLAAALSIIPGLGRVYTGNYVDAGFSLLTIGTFSWQSIAGFSKNGISSSYAWITGVLASGFYLGNIYGSYRAAQLKNRLNKKSLFDATQRAYHLLP